jgi:uncharacterized protein YkwD
VYGRIDPTNRGGSRDSWDSAPPAGQPPYLPSPAPADRPPSPVGAPVAARTGPSGGRHRCARQWSGPLVLGAAVAVLLGVIGIGAGLLPMAFARTSAATSAGAPATPTNWTGRSRTVDAGPVTQSPPSSASARPAPAPTTARPTTSPRATPARATPSKRTPSRPAVRATGGSSTEADQILTLVNEARGANGCGAVQINTELTAAAQLHSDDQAAHSTMSHTGSDGSTPWQRAEAAGYQYAIGENVAYGYPTATAVMAAWMGSPGHRANILNCEARAFGVGMAASNGVRYWTEMFGSES